MMVSYLSKKNSQENIISIKENTLKVLDDLKDNEIKSLNSNENLVVAGKTETESLFSKRERLISTFENDLQLINEAYRFLVKSYREKNESIRETEVPIYFKDPIENLDVDIPPFTNLKLSNYLIEDDDLYNTARNEITDHYNSLIKQLQ